MSCMKGLHVDVILWGCVCAVCEGITCRCDPLCVCVSCVKRSHVDVVPWGGCVMCEGIM